VKPKKAVGIQYAALPWRIVGRRLEILLVTSRESRRWVIPKGWPMKGKAPQETAAVEAYEEAGVTGEIDGASVGSFRYLKRLKREEAVPIQVIVFPLEVTSQLDHWKEKDQRQFAWFRYQKAAALVVEPNLKRLIRDFGQAHSSGALYATTRFGRWLDAAFFGLKRS
jgi:8-oxo-dGTP pyrophosphatase MutT (NUDIX family)